MGEEVWSVEADSKSSLAGIKYWQGQWTTSVAYIIGDGVYDSAIGSSYICTASHTADTDSRPGSGADWADYWDLLASVGGSSGTDSDAIHDNVAAEISIITEKTTIVAADKFIVEDSADSHNKKMMQYDTITGGASSVELGYVNGVTSSVQTQLDAKVALTGNQTVAGIKTFSSFPVTPSAAPTTDYQVSNKKYVDDSVGDGSDTSAIHDDTASEISAVTEKVTPISGDFLLIEDSADSNNKKRVQVGNLPTASGGEVNTASNVGTAGVGLFKQKTSFDLEFKKINAGSANITITDDTGNSEVDIDIASAPTLVGTNFTGIPAAGVELNEIATATYKTVQAWSNNTQSAGTISGGLLTDGGSGTLDISIVKGILKTTNSEIGANVFFDLAAASGQTLTDNSVNYIAVDYNAGTPQLVIGVTSTANGHTIYNLGKVYREGTTLDIITSGLNLYDFVKRTQQHHVEESSLHIVSGAIVSETGTRNIAMTSGIMYAGLNRIITDAIDTSVADTFEYYYYNGSAWTESDQTQIDNLQYNNIASGLATLANNQYGVHWVYKGTNSTTFVIYGQDSYTLSEAQSVQPPSSLPDHIDGFGVLRAKIIILKSAAVFEDIESVADTQFTASSPANHNDLGGIQGGTAGEYYHFTSARYTQLVDLADLTPASSLIIGDGLGGWETTTVANLKTSMSLNNVENTALSTWAGSSNIVTVGTVTAGNVDAVVSAASLTSAGKIEIATVAETTTGTDATRAVSPDGLAGSVYGEQVVSFIVVEGATDTETGDKAGNSTFRVPAKFNGWDLVDIEAHVETAGTTGTTDIQIRNITQTADMLSTKVTIDSGETDSSTAATPPVIDTGNDDVATGDKLAIDVDAISTTAAKGLTVEMTFRRP